MPQFQHCETEKGNTTTGSEKKDTRYALCHTYPAYAFGRDVLQYPYAVTSAQSGFPGYPAHEIHKGVPYYVSGAEPIAMANGTHSERS